MKPRIKALEGILFIVFVVGFLFLVPLGKIVHAVQSVSPVHFWLACLLTLPISYLSAARLYKFVHRQGIDLPRLKLFQINLITRFYSFFSPASSVGSLWRWYKISEAGKSAEALSAVAVNRILDIFIAVILGLFWVVGGRSLIHPVTFLAVIALVILIWFLTTRYAPIFLAWWVQKWKISSHSWLKKGSSFLERLSVSLAVYSQFSAFDLVLLIFLGLMGELISLLSFILLARSIHIPLSFFDLGWMKSVFFLASLTPFTLPGGIGLREVSVVVVLSTFGVSPELAAAFSFLLYARGVIAGILGGLIELSTLIRMPLHEKI